MLAADAQLTVAAQLRMYRWVVWEWGFAAAGTTLNYQVTEAEHRDVRSPTDTDVVLERRLRNDR